MTGWKLDTDHEVALAAGKAIVIDVDIKAAATSTTANRIEEPGTREAQPPLFVVSSATVAFAPIPAGGRQWR
jgi:hypothetical protein